MKPEGLAHSNLTSIVLIHIVKHLIKSGSNICTIELMVRLNITRYIPHISYK